MSNSIYHSQLSAQNDFSPKLMKLMVKKHMVTGKKYLCKTTEKNHHAYKGSGVKWKKMLEEHGKEHVRTIVIFTSHSKSLFREVAERMSERLDVVASDDWANLQIETGHGGSKKGRIVSEENRAKMSAIQKKYNREHPEKRRKQSETRKKKFKDPEYREMYRAAGRKRYENLEQLEMLRRNAIKQFSDPEARARTGRNQANVMSNRKAANSVEFVSVLREALK